MAEARQGYGGTGSLEAELTCPICLGLYRDPVTLRCGHNFCRPCMANTRGARQRSQGPYTCPMCRVHLGPTLELQSNFQLAGIVEAFKATSSKGQRDESSEEGKTGGVPCEYCLDRHTPAVKTCLGCNVSLCQAHLSKHNAKASQQEHILVKVGAGEAQERRCPEHGKLLECYCLKEDKLICVLCSIAGAHKGHEVITMKEERDRRLVKLSDPMTDLQESKSDLVKALQELQESENQIKTNTRAVTSQVEKLFENINTELATKKKILSDIQLNEKKHLADIGNARREMGKKRAQAEQNLQALQKIKEQPDVFLFFKELKLVTDRIASLDLDTERVEVEEVQLDASMIAQCQALREKLMCQLDSLLRDVRDKLANQMEWGSEASATDSSPE